MRKVNVADFTLGLSAAVALISVCAAGACGILGHEGVGKWFMVACFTAMAVFAACGIVVGFLAFRDAR